MTGKIKNVNSKGFGFIQCGGEEFFFHRSGYLGNWDELERYMTQRGRKTDVTFDEEESAKGPRATNVKLV